MASTGIQGHKLEITVVGCNQLKDTWYGRHKPYVAVMYGTDYHRTGISKDGGKNPSFNEKFEITLIEGVLEIKVHVFSSHHVMDNFIGHGKVDLEKVFAEGCSTTANVLVPLESMTGKQAGEVSLTLEFRLNSNLIQQQGEDSNTYTHDPQSQQLQQQLQLESDYMDQQVHEARMRMIDAQIRRSSESMDTMGTIGTSYRWEYTDRYGNGRSGMGGMGGIG